MHIISFPGLGIHNLHVNSTAFTVGNFSIQWYGILIALGLLLAMLYGLKRAPQFHITVDDLTDAIIFGLIFAIIGARLYYVIFDPDRATYFTSFLDVVNIRNGGLGIYGGIIAAFLTAFVVCRVKKISIGAVFDVASLGFLIGQSIGRWGNFFNQEAYGSKTSLPWGMKITDNSFDVYSGQVVTVHPCFLYESLWCILGFIVLHNLSKKRRFNGEVFLLYVMWYSFGRFFIEILRTDSLMLGATIKISMLVAAVLFLAALILFIVRSLGSRSPAASEYQSVYGEAAQALSEQAAELEEFQKEGFDEDADETEGTADEENPEETPESEEQPTEKSPDTETPEEK